eukprot:33757-Eustigmatos_ZCMA.PRE.1
MPARASTTNPNSTWCNWVSEIDMKKAVRKQLGEDMCIDLTLVPEVYSTVPTEAIVVVTSPLIETHKITVPACVESK